MIFWREARADGAGGSARRCRRLAASLKNVSYAKYIPDVHSIYKVKLGAARAPMASTAYIITASY